MKRLLVLLLSLSLLAAVPPDEDLRMTALRWLARVDAQDKGPIYNGLTESVKKTKSRAAILNQLREKRARFGEAKGHKVVAVEHKESWVLVRIQSTFEDGVLTQENVWLSEDEDKTWRISGYELVYLEVSVTKLGETPK